MINTVWPVKVERVLAGAVCFFAMSAVLIPWSNVQAMELVRDGAPQACIVVPDDPFPVVTYAAEELQYHIELATGAKLPIVSEIEAPAGGTWVVLGDCRASVDAGIESGELPPNGYVVKVIGSRLFLVGDDSDGPAVGVLLNNRTRAGTLFAVYEFLEREMGARWLWPGELGEVIDHRTDLVIDDTLNEVGKPAFIHTRWRDHGAGDAEDWSSAEARDRFIMEQSKWLRRNRFAIGVNMNMAHAFTGWWERYKDEHPDYFNLLPDGTRRPDPFYKAGRTSLVAMCVSNPGLHKQVVQDWLKSRSPEKPYIVLSENDTAGKCTCERCMSWDVPDPDLDIPWNQRLDYARSAFNKEGPVWEDVSAGHLRWEQYLGSLSDRYARFALAVQKEAEKYDPNVVVMLYAYANYYKPPLATKLNDRVVIGYVPSGYFPFTDKVRSQYREFWDDWRATGARLFLRPNWTLDGHVFPLFTARRRGEDFRYFAQNGMIGTDFDSLTGQYGAQGPDLYMIARLTSDPVLTVDEVLDEYYSAFGKAEQQIRAYFAHWERVSDAVEKRPEGNGGWRFYPGADEVFTSEVMAQGRQFLKDAEDAARGDQVIEQRVAFLDNGLKQAELVLVVQAAHEAYEADAKWQNAQAYRDAMARLDEFRKEVDQSYVTNIRFVAHENQTWHRRQLQNMKGLDGEPLSTTWKFMWDPDGQGIAGGWAGDSFDDSKWFDVGVLAPWKDYEAGSRWRSEHGEDYLGVAWYRSAFPVEMASTPQSIRLLFGAVDQACTVWVNGELALQRPYPYQGDQDSWKKPFEVDVTELVRYDRPNVLAVRVEAGTGVGGIWRPVSIQRSALPVSQAENAVQNASFENEAKRWSKSNVVGTNELQADETVSRSGDTSARIACAELAPEGEHRYRAWARWHQKAVPVTKGASYRLRVWVKTSDDFNGKAAVWFRSGGSVHANKNATILPTMGLWKEAVVEGIVPEQETAHLYLNLIDGTGTVWFDDVELVKD